MKTSRVFGLGSIAVASLLLLASFVGCQTALSDEDINRIVDRVAEQPLSEDDADRFVDALMDNPKYQEYLNDEEWVDEFPNAMMEHPTMRTTAEEDCATVILMAAVMSGEYDMPPESETEKLCAWYIWTRSIPSPSKP